MCSGSPGSHSFFRIETWFLKVWCFFIFSEVHFGGLVSSLQGLRAGRWQCLWVLLTPHWPLFTREAAAPWSQTKEYPHSPIPPKPLNFQGKQMYLKIITQQAFPWSVTEPSHHDTLAILLSVPTHLFIHEKKFRKRTCLPWATDCGQHCWKRYNLRWQEPESWRYCF